MHLLAIGSPTITFTVALLFAVLIVYVFSINILNGRQSRKEIGDGIITILFFALVVDCILWGLLFHLLH